MSLEVRFVERSVGRIPVARTSARAGGSALPGVLDLSPKGLKAVFQEAPAVGAALKLEISHPSLKSPLAVEGDVRWVRPATSSKDGHEGFAVGLAFRTLPLPARARLAELIALELGSRILLGNAPIGYAGSGGDLEGAIYLYDASLKTRAVIRRDGAEFKVERTDEAPDHEGPLGAVASFEAAIRLAFDREGPVKLDPPLALD